MRPNITKVLTGSLIAEAALRVAATRQDKPEEPEKPKPPKPVTFWENVL